MKVVQVVAYYPPRTGGMQTCVQEISERLAKNGHEVEVFTSDIGCNGKKLSSHPRLKIHYLKGFQFAHTAFIPMLLFKLLRISKNSIIHVHIAQVFVPEMVYLAAKIRNIPYIAHIHADVEPTGRLGILLPIYKKLFLKHILENARRVVVLNDKYEAVIRQKYSLRESISIIPNGVNERFFLNGKVNLQKPASLLYVGRLSVEKNIPRLVLATARLSSKVILHIVGDGEKKEEIKKLISDNNLLNVVLHGKKEGSSLVNFYKSADAFLLASDTEGLPLVLLEAMASGTPIVASNVIGIKELVGDTGILVKKPSSKSFASAIKTLLVDKKLRLKLIKRGKAKAEEYKWKGIIERFEALYKLSI